MAKFFITIISKLNGTTFAKLNQFRGAFCVQKIRGELRVKEADCYPGKRVGRLTLISRQRVSTEHYGNRWQWLCKCDCGRERKYYTFQIGLSPSKKGYVDCGQHKVAKARISGKLGRKSDSEVSDTNNRSPWRRLYVKWEDMIRRCYNPNIANYHNYGGRGIGVCDEWKNSYKAFKELGYYPRI